MSLSQSPQRPAYLADSLQKQGALGRWYLMLAYHLPQGQQPTLKDQEIIRRSRLATFVLVVQLMLIEGPVIPVVAAAPNGHVILPWLWGCISILLVAFVCNRTGRLTLAGVLMVLSIEITVCLKILTVPGGIGVASLPQFDILIQPVLLAVVLLPPWSAFAVAGFNIAFILFALIAGPHAPDLVAALRDPHLQGDIFAVPIMAQFIIATVAVLIVANLLSALKRANKAEQIAALQHAIAEEQRKFESRNQELEQGITALVQTIQSSANNQGGSYEQVNLPPGHVLWPVLQQIWQFLNRFQRARQAEISMEATVRACTSVIQMLEAARQGHAVPYPTRSNTPVDGIIVALQQASSSQQRRPGTASGALARPNTQE